jgi:hypothetical protein
MADARGRNFGRPEDWQMFKRKVGSCRIGGGSDGGRWPLAQNIPMESAPGASQQGMVVIPSGVAGAAMFSHGATA